MQEVMKNLILACLLALAALGGGYWWGKNHAASRSSIESKTTFTREQLPPMPPRKIPVADTNNAAPAGKLSLAELEQKISSIKIPDWRWGMGGQRDLWRMLETAEPADVPELIAFADKNSSLQIRQMLR